MKCILYNLSDRESSMNGIYNKVLARPHIDLTTKISHFKIELKNSFSLIKMMETKSNGKKQTLTLHSIICEILSFHYLFPTLTVIEEHTDECGTDKRRPLYPQGQVSGVS